MENAATLLFLAITLVSAAAAVALTTRFLGSRGAQQRPLSGSNGSGSDMLRRYQFREGYLLSDIDLDDSFIEANTDRTAAFSRLVAGLIPLSPDFKARLIALQERGEAVTESVIAIFRRLRLCSSIWMRP